VHFLKKITSFLFLAFYFLSATATVDLLKLPLLIRHYQQHKATNKNIGIISFLKIHYQQQDNLDNNSNNDHQLPFKTHYHTAVTSIIAMPPPLFLVFPIKPVSFKKETFKVPDHFLLPAKYLAIIWQPPRNC
jgi:hypothetical protein